MATFFIDRPVFAWVLAILTMLAGMLAIKQLPVEGMPDTHPPIISVTANYSGADAYTVQNSVTQLLEQNIKGIDNLLYMTSSSSASGRASLMLRFKSGTDPDVAQTQVQNKVQANMSALPQTVRERGSITVAKNSGNTLMQVAFTSTDEALQQTDIADYVSANILDNISRISGVGTVELYGAPYAMRIWLDPYKLHYFQLTSMEVRQAIAEQNNQVAAGQLGTLPVVPEQRLQAPIIAQTGLTSAAEFGNILLKVNVDGSQVRLHDVATVELGASSYNFISHYNGKPTAVLSINLGSGANALAVAVEIKTQLERLEPSLPYGLQIVHAYDTTPFIKMAISTVIQTLVEAIVLVFLIMYLFLQNFRATLIPTLAIPVVLLGTFAVLALFGYSINKVTLFAMVLAIGLLVDDAIVVVENVERVMQQEGLSPKQATKKAMGQIQTALIGITVVIAAVFIPMAFYTGSIGIIFRQFSVPVVAAMTLSALVALIFTPALCATLLKPIDPAKQGKKSGFLALFNRFIENSTGRYITGVQHILQHTGRYLLSYLACIITLAILFWSLPSTLYPDEDEGYLFNAVELPSGATQAQTQQMVDKVAHYYLEKHAVTVNSVFTFVRGHERGQVLISLKPWNERPGAANTRKAIARRAREDLAHIKEGKIFISSQGGEGRGDFKLQLLDKANIGREKLVAASEQLLAMAKAYPQILAHINTEQEANIAQLKITIDHEKARSLGINISNINTTLNHVFAGTYINDFNDRGAVKGVYLQGAAPFRMLPEDIYKWYVRNNTGDMVSFSAFASMKWQNGPKELKRYNGFSSIAVTANPAPGKNSGEAMALLQQLAEKLPEGVSFEWDGRAHDQRKLAEQMPLFFALTVLVVFLSLAALYESWSIPFSVILVVPLGIIGVLLGAWLRGLPLDMFFQIAFLATIGLAARNAILIIEFAKDLMEKEGQTLIEATLEAARLRLRPILMTSLSFIFGVLPMALSGGAGSGAQNSLGTGVIGGMFTGTVLAILFVPLFFVVIRRYFPKVGDRIN